MKEIQIKKYTKDSLEFINRLSEKLLEESIASIKEITNKSYLIISVYFSIQVFCFRELTITEQKYEELYFTILISFFIPILFIFRNIFPTQIQKVGSKGSLLVDEYYEEPNENQIKKYLSSRIEDLDTSINLNFNQINTRIQRVKWSFFSVLIIIIIISFYWFLFSKGLV